MAFTDAFVFPYRSRIMACLPNQEPVELFRTRSNGPLNPSDVHMYTSELSPGWSWWIERQTHHKHLCSSRPLIRNPHINGAKPKGPLRIVASPSHAYSFLHDNPAAT